MIKQIIELKRYKKYFITIFLLGIIIHGYVLTNKVPNVDDVTLLEGPGGGPVIQGRWMFGVLGKFSNVVWNDMSMPWVKGLTAIFFIALSALLLIDIFEIDTSYMGISIGVLLVSFPTIAMNMTFMYLADHFCFSILLATSAVWIAHYAIKLEKRKWILVTIACITMSLGIYQAYFPYAAAFLLLDILYSLSKEDDIKSVYKKGMTYLIILAGGMLGYFGINKAAITWMGMDKVVLYGKNMGEIDISQIPQIIGVMYKEFIRIFTENYVGIHYYTLIRILIGVAFVTGSVLVFIKMIMAWRQHDKVRSLLLFLVWMIYPLAVNLIYLMVAGNANDVYAMMVYSLTSIFFLPIVLIKTYEGNCIKCIKSALVGIVVLACVYYARLDNDMYLYATFSHQTAVSYYTQMANRITDVEGYNPTDKIVFVGKDIVQDSIYDLQDKFYHLQGIAGIGGMHNRNIMRETSDHYLSKYCAIPNEFDFSEEKKAYYSEISVQKNMTNYPEKGSLEKIDDVIVIRLGE